jgi:hypothetical protein
MPAACIDRVGASVLSTAHKRVSVHSGLSPVEIADQDLAVRIDSLDAVHLHVGLVNHEVGRFEVRIDLLEHTQDLCNRGTTLLLNVKHGHRLSVPVIVDHVDDKHGQPILGSAIGCIHVQNGATIP